jgi:hypothetical protein
MKKKYLELYIELIKLFVVSTVYEKKVCTVLPWWSTISPISTKWTTTSLSSNHWDQSHLHSKESYSTKEEEEEHDLWCCKFYAIFIKLNQFFLDGYMASSFWCRLWEFGKDADLRIPLNTTVIWDQMTSENADWSRTVIWVYNI